MTGKEIVTEWMPEFPDSWSVENVIDALAVRAEWRPAEAEIEAGDFMTQEQIERESAEWRSP
jgi:hypothetical protein